MIVESIAAVCHEANRRYCREIGDTSQLPWEAASWWQKQSAVASVLWNVQNPDAPLSAAHDIWLQHRLEEGWRFGTILDEGEKTHPNVLPYDELPPQQKVKDSLFRSIVLALTEGENHV